MNAVRIIMESQQEYRLVLRAQRSDIPVAVRLRKLLKYAGRVCGLRMVRLEEVLVNHVTKEGERTR